LPELPETVRRRLGFYLQQWVNLIY